MDNVHAIVLAAGHSRRYGAPKQLLRWRGATLLEHAVEQAQAVCGGCVTVVLGAGAKRIGTTLSADGLNIVVNDRWQEGMASSVRAGITALPADADAALFMLCDQPLIKPETLSELVQRWRAAPGAIAACRYRGTHGVPAVFPRRVFAELLELRGECGAKRVIRAHADRLIAVPAPEAGIDIDTPEDLKALLSEYDLTGVQYDHAYD